MARISIERVEERRRINRSIRDYGMKETVRRVMEEKDMDCPAAKHYIHKIRE